jgi:hypothetical protein
MICKCNHDETIHAKNEPRVCSDPNCACWGFHLKPAPRPDYEKILSLLSTTEEKIKWLLDNLPELKELSNQEFIFVYWQIVDKLLISTDTIHRITDYQAIERVKRLLVAEQPEKYAPKRTDLIDKKGIMSFVIQEYVTQR